ncbi:hypothetical protein ACQ4PT_049838 [Festuca glaucescens]
MIGAITSRDCFLDPALYTGHPVVHFDVPTAAGRQIFSVQCCAKNEEAIVSPLGGSSRDDLAAARSESGPLIVVFVDSDGKYFTDYDSPQIDLLMPKALSFLSRRIDPDDPDLIYHVLESTRERAIRRILCWPDGTRTSRLQSEPVDQRRCWMLQLVRALVGKYNDDHNLLGDLAYGLQGVVCYHVFNEGGNNRRMYYHVNFTANTKDRKDLLFFAETISEQRDELVVSCICRINPSDKDRGHCHACLSDVKHPKDDAYFGGHSSVGVLSGTYHSHGPKEDLGVTAAQLKDEESRVRYSHKGPKDPNFLEKLRAPVEVNFPPPRPIEETIAFISRAGPEAYGLNHVAMPQARNIAFDVEDALDDLTFHTRYGFLDPFPLGL